MSRGRVLRLACAVLAALGLWQTGEGAYIHAKAAAAQVLLRAAWARSVSTGAPVRPWPWADHWPVGRLLVPGLGVDLVLLAGASGASLAFAPGHLHGSPLPGDPGVSVVSAHRDTHFRFLRRLRPGDEIRVETVNGGAHRFRAAAFDVVDARRTGIAFEGEAPRLLLVTCYPFDAVRPGGPLRYAVTAVAVPPGNPRAG